MELGEELYSRNYGESRARTFRDADERNLVRERSTNPAWHYWNVCASQATNWSKPDSLSLPALAGSRG